MQNTEVTAHDLEAIRQLNAKRQREWWAKMTPAERKARRLQYALNAIRKAEAATAGKEE